MLFILSCIYYLKRRYKLWKKINHYIMSSIRQKYLGLKVHKYCNTFFFVSGIDLVYKYIRNGLWLKTMKGNQKHFWKPKKAFNLIVWFPLYLFFLLFLLLLIFEWTLTIDIIFGYSNKMRGDMNICIYDGL